MWSWQTQIWSYSPAWGPARGMQRFSHEIVSDSFVTPWTVAFQAPLSVGFLQERMQMWVAVSFSRGLPDPRIEPVSSALAGRFLTTEPPGKPGECRGCEKNIPSSGQCSGILLPASAFQADPSWRTAGKSSQGRLPHWAHPGTLSLSQPPSRYFPGLQFHDRGLTTRFSSPAELCLPTTTHTKN